MSRAPVRIAGAGALGLSVALALLRRGVAVEVWDPGRPAASASGVAAGMLAAVTEAVLEQHGRPWDGDVALDALLSAARDRWVECAIGLNLPIDHSGALLPAVQAWEAESVARHFSRFETSRLVDGDEARALQPWLGADVAAAVFAPDDWRIDPLAALAALRTAVVKGGGWLRAEPLPMASLLKGEVVLATGYAKTAFPVPELAHLRPIKGQIVRLAGGPATGATVRAQGAYIAPQPGGCIIGATMEEGLDDIVVEPDAVARLLTAAEAVMPGLRGLPARGMAGVRAATPDGLPLVGPSSQLGVWLATGARRNGWLLAPLVGQMLAAYLTGDDPGRFAAMLDPRRFDR